MVTLPKRPRGLFRYERDGKCVLSNLESGLILRASPLLLDFLAVCEQMTTSEVKHHLKAKHPGANVEHFLKRIELYAPHLFADEPAPARPRTFSLSGWQAKAPKVFTTLTLNLTHDCNLQCDYCTKGIAFRQDAQTMPAAVAVKAAAQFMDQLQGQAGQVIFTGGEPLLCFATIREVVQAVQARRAPVSFLLKTNATLLTPEIRQYLNAAGFTFQVSLDGPKAVHDWHRRDAGNEGSFEGTMAGIRGLLADGMAQRVKLQGTVTHETVGSIGESFDFLKSLGARSATIKPVMSNRPEVALDAADQELYGREVFRQARQTAMRGQGPGKDDDLQTDGICGIGLWHIAVDVDGATYPCYRLSGMEAYRMGHIDQGMAAAPPAEVLNLFDWEDPTRCGACTRRVLCSRGCYAERLLGPRTSPCDNVERSVGECIIASNFQNDDVIDMLPRL